MPNYEKLYYESQAQLADLAEELRKEETNGENWQKKQKKEEILLQEKGLTIWKNRGIIIKLSDERAKLRSPKSAASWEKWRAFWDWNFARSEAEESGQPVGRQRADDLKAKRFSEVKSKNFEKSLKKGLTNFRKCGIINKSPDDETSKEKLRETT